MAMWSLDLKLESRTRSPSLAGHRGMLGEKAQISAAKEICHIIIKQMNTVGESAEIGGAFPI